MSRLFKSNKLRHSQRRLLNLFVPRVKHTTFGLKSSRYEGAILWNSLLEHITHITYYTVPLSSIQPEAETSTSQATHFREKSLENLPST